MGCPTGRVQGQLLPKLVELSGPSALLVGRGVLWAWGWFQLCSRKSEGVCVNVRLSVYDSVIVCQYFLCLCVNVCASV